MRKPAFLGCVLSIAPLVAAASSHFSSGGTAHAARGAKPITSIGVKYGTSPSTVTYSALTSGERIGVNCPTDRQCLLLQLRTQGLELKEKDGGKLTPEHRTQLQSELDSINARFH
jgi:hypothetical protein